jgi:hypothetical protein
MRASICLLLLLSLPSLAAAQTGLVYNPTRIEFQSPDHDTQVSSYIVEYWLEGVDPATGQPYTTSTLSKNNLTLTTGGYYTSLLASLEPMPAIQVGKNYRATVTAVGLTPDLKSARSPLSNPFAQALAPANPQAVSIR